MVSIVSKLISIFEIQRIMTATGGTGGGGGLNDDTFVKERLLSFSGRVTGHLSVSVSLAERLISGQSLFLWPKDWSVVNRCFSGRETDHWSVSIRGQSVSLVERLVTGQSLFPWLRD